MHDIEYYNSIFISFQIQFYDVLAAFIHRPDPYSIGHGNSVYVKKETEAGFKKNFKILLLYRLFKERSKGTFFKNRLYNVHTVYFLMVWLFLLGKIYLKTFQVLYKETGNYFAMTH